MKIHITLLTLLISCNTHSAVWPDTTAPCNTTLNACIDGTAAGSSVEIRTNTIDEDITKFKAISLIAGAGYRPVLTDGNGIDITVSSGNNHNMTIKGLDITRGRISVNHFGSGDLGLTISNNRFEDNSSAGTSIRVLQRGSGTLDLDIDYNTINHNFFSSGIEVDSGAITVLKNLENGDLSGRIYGNTVHVVGTNGSTVGIGVYNQQAGNFELNITGNEIHTTHNGIRVSSFPPGDDSNLDINNNAIYAIESLARMIGIAVYSNFNTINADVVNNTIIGANIGAEIFQDGVGGVVNATFYNNLIAYGDFDSYPIYTNIDIDNDNNLFYDFAFSDDDFIPGPNHLTNNPQLQSLSNARLRPGSPAVDTGSTLALLFVGDAPLIDADGLLRIKRPANASGPAIVDIGAYESGDLYFTHKTNSPNSHISNLNAPYLNDADSLDDLHITANYNPPSTTGIYNNDNEGIYYSNGLWRIFNQDFVELTVGAAFNIYKFAATTNTFEQTAVGSTENNTVIDNSVMNGNPDRIVHVSQNWTGVYNPHPFSVFYFFSSWVIINNDLETMDDGANFNVYHQQSSKSAWKLRVSAANSFGNSVIIDHPLLNGSPCAQIQVTQGAEFGIFNDSPIGVWFNGSNWLIFNQDLSAMPLDASFHIIINPEQIAACSDLIFADDFE